MRCYDPAAPRRRLARSMLAARQQIRLETDSKVLKRERAMRWRPHAFEEACARSASWGKM